MEKEQSFQQMVLWQLYIHVQKNVLDSLRVEGRELNQEVSHCRLS